MSSYAWLFADLQSDFSSSSPFAFEEVQAESDARAPGTVVNDARSSVLGNEDLLHLIFSFYPVVPLRDCDSATSQFGPYPFDTSEKDTECNVRESRDVLLKASLTCKTFFYPAIRALWRSIDSVNPLVKLVSGVVLQGSLLTTTMAMSEEDLQRFDFYARLVKSLVFSEKVPRRTESDYLVAPHIFPIIHNHRPQGLLPSLKVLEIKMVDKPLRPEHVWLVNSLVPSAGPLSQLIIKGIPVSIQGQALVASIIKSVHMKSPRLISIALGEYQNWVISDVVRNIGSLQSVSLDLSTTTSHLVHAPSNNGSFSNLMNLYVIGSVYSVRLVFNVMFAGVLSQLKNLRISLVPLFVLGTQLEDFRSLINAITLRETSPLESFVLDHVTNLNGSAVAFQLTLAWLKGFNEESFRTLKALSIPVSDTVSGKTFTTMFATPHQSLVWLDISSAGYKRDGHWNSGFERSSKVLKVIHDMIPNLKYLAIPILLNTKDGHLQFIRRVSQEACSGHGLQELRLKPFGIYRQQAKAYPKFHRPSENISDLLMIARYIDHLFPCLMEINTGDLRSFVQERWLDGLETAVKQYAEFRKSLKRHYEACGREE